MHNGVGWLKYCVLKVLNFLKLHNFKQNSGILLPVAVVLVIVRAVFPQYFVSVMAKSSFTSHTWNCGARNTPDYSLNMLLLLMQYIQLQDS